MAHVWPNTRVLMMVSSGLFATVFPKVKFILGPNVALRSVGCAASEAGMGLPHDGKLDESVLKSDDAVIEFLDVSLEETHEHLCQAWEVQAGKQYEPILTTRDCHWRYRMSDILSIIILSIIGFDTESGAPVFKYSGRRSLAVRLAHAQITDDQLLAAIHAFNDDAAASEDAIRVQEFTTMIDDRALPPTVSFVVELAGPLGPNAHLTPERLFDALVATNVDHARAREHGQMRLPTIRVVGPGTFADYRRWKGESVNVVSGQIKVPLALVQPAAQAWMLEKVVREL
ncbi:GH3 auxin-responsive promoter [Boletus coccyginus]|nr:GH3 auxin-responsive promoter [Boletus coccyginus]